MGLNKRNLSQSFRFKAVVWANIFAFAVGPTAEIMAEALPNTPIQERLEPKPTMKPMDSLTKEVADLFESPFLEAVKNAESLPPVNFDFSSTPYLLDVDPFFLRSQKWVENKTLQADETDTVRETSNGIEITLATDKATEASTLVLDLPFNFVLQTDQYVFLAPRSAEFFASHGGGEGLFVLEKKQLEQMADSQLPAPVFFLPLVGQGWSGKVKAWDLADHGYLALETADQKIYPVELEDIHTVISAERLNLFLALSENTSVENSDPREILYPKIGSTAGFGIFCLAGSTPMELPTDDPSFMQKVLEIFGIPAAGAAEYTPEQLAQIAKEHAKLYSRLALIGKILGVSLVTSVVLKHTLFKSKFAARRARVPESEQPKTFTAKAKREVREDFDVYAAVLTTISQTPTLPPAALIEEIFDRFAPSIASGDNRLIRQILDTTVLFSKRSAQKVPVNWKTWVMGSIVFGGADCVQVWSQLYYANGWIARELASVFPSMEPRVMRVYDPTNPLTSTYNSAELARNAAGYLSRGASSYSQEKQSQSVLELETKAYQDLKREGKIPESDPKFKAELDRRVNAGLGPKLNEAGLPGPDEFLGDWSTILEKTYELLGLRINTKEDFVGNNRPGLVLSSLSRAISELEYAAKREPNKEAAIHEALKLMIEVRRKVSLARSILTNDISTWVSLSGFRQNIQTIREARQALIALTYQGVLPVDMSKLPTSWVKDFSSRASFIAASFYRTSFFAYQKGNSKLVDGVSEAEAAPFREQANAEALQTIKLMYLSETQHLSDRQILERYTSEHKLMSQLRVTELAVQAEADRQPYQDEADWPSVASHKQKIWGQALRQFEKQFNKPFDPATATAAELARWRVIHRRAYAKSVGVEFDFVSQPQLKDQIDTGVAEFVAEVTKEPKLKAYLETLSPIAAEFRISNLASSAAVSAYVNATVEGGIRIHGLDPSQPGTFQRLRRTKFLRSNNIVAKTIVGTLRTYEGMVSDSSYTPGRMAWIDRNIPLAFDLRTSLLRQAKNTFICYGPQFLFFKYFWGANFPYALWAFSMVFWFTIAGPNQTLNRIFKNFRVQVFSSWPKAMAFSVPYSWATFLGGIPVALYQEEATRPHVWPWFLTLGIVPIVPVLWKNLVPLQARNAIKRGLALKDQLKAAIAKVFAPKVEAPVTVVTINQEDFNSGKVVQHDEELRPGWSSQLKKGIDAGSFTKAPAPKPSVPKSNCKPTAADVGRQLGNNPRGNNDQPHAP